MPGAGKTTVGVLLAERIGFAFMDTDITIQIREGRRLQEIIAIEGLAGFGRIEEQAILSIAVRSHVIATGGSVVYSKKAMQHLKAGGTVCHLDADPRRLLERINNMDSRGIAMQPGQSFTALWKQRRPLYLAFADFTVATGDLAPAQVVNAILDTLCHHYGYCF